MGKLYLFAIGGTGSRVLKSLTMLFASGCSLGNDYDTIIPIVLDPDLQNGDMNRTRDLIGYYQNVQKEVSSPEKFFKQKIQALSSVDGSNVDNKILYTINTQEQDFGDFINYHNQSRDNQYFLNLLFSKKNRESDLSVGFKGNPNMGAVVLNKFIMSEDFQNFEKVFTSNDSIFIVSSIFGGTGAAGFPLVLKKLRSSSNSDVRTAKIGALSLQPYFTVLNNDNSEIDSSTFNEKAKAALGYYKRSILDTNLLDSFYIIGYDTPKAISNSEGAESQRNNANFIELACALSIFDFCKSQDPKGTIKEFGVENYELPLKPICLGGYDKDLTYMPMSKFKLMSNYLRTSINNNTSWRKNFKDLENNTGYESLMKVVDLYEEWITEMTKAEPKFEPFIDVSADNAMNFINGRPIKQKLFFGPSVNFKELDKNLNDSIDKGQGDFTFGRFIKMFDVSTEKTLEKII